MIELKSFLLGKKLSGGNSGEVATKEVDVFPETELPFITLNDGMLYATECEVFGLKTGEKYILVIDGTAYKSVTAITPQSGAVCCGNLSLYTLDSSHNTGENYLFGDVDGSGVIFTTLSGSSHTIRIYQVVEATDLFPQTKSVELSMANGNQVVNPDEGFLLSEVTVNKPATLIPENIAEGIDIGGVIGSLVAGGGANVKVASGVTTAHGVYQFEHNLGVVPDIILLAYTSSGNYLRTAWGISSKLNVLLNIKSYMQNYTYANSGTTTTNFYKGCITFNTASATCLIYGTNETIFKINSSLVSTASGTVWVAIGGLTE